jgi:thiamine pyrophosphate-dependent acetolactate synthase large subunit-like protein
LSNPPKSFILSDREMEMRSKAGQARGLQIDRNPDRIGLRYPVEIGLAGDVQATLVGLPPLLKRQADRRFLTEARSRMRDRNALLECIEALVDPEEHSFPPEHLMG